MAQSNPQRPVIPASSRSDIVVALLWRCFSLLYGVVTLCVFLLLAFTTKKSFRKLSSDDRRSLAIARANLWDLSKRPYGLTHKFCVLRDGTKFHYVVWTPNDAITTGTNGLVIFLHGFPDSWILWQHFLRNNRLRANATLIAVDLPGYGGSDSLPCYGPSEVLDRVTEVIIRLRDEYSSGSSPARRAGNRVLLVGHDWGTIIGFRLAAEAPQLADRFILGNAVHPPLALANIRCRIKTTYSMLHTWLSAPSQFRLLFKAFANIRPILVQLGKSSYVFCFNLPMPILKLLNVGEFWMLRFLNAVMIEPDPAFPLRGAHGAEALANSVGPSLQECNRVEVKDLGTGAVTEVKYSESVRSRASTGGFLDKVCLYRNGLFSKPWDKSLEIIWDLQQLLNSQQARRRSSSSGGLFDLGPEGMIKGPTTVIWGKEDVAVEHSIATAGFSDYFGAKSSQLIMIKDCGHWSPVQKQGAAVFEEVIVWALEGEDGSLRKRLSDEVSTAKVVIEK